MSKGFNNKVSNILKGMRTSDWKVKGDQGELAIFSICEKQYQKHGGLLYHSYTYPTDKSLVGNIKREGTSLRSENLSGKTEIDILYVSPFRIIPIEVKSYRSDQITLTDSAIEGCKADTKSPIHQNEMHCRHLLSGIVEAVPNGDEEYIKPIVVFVDKCKLVDKRSSWQKEYIPKSTLNYFEELLQKSDTRYNNTYINLSKMESKLDDLMIDCSKKLPLRYV